MVQLSVTSLTLGILLLAVADWTVASNQTTDLKDDVISQTAIKQLRRGAARLRNDSADGYYNTPKSDLSNVTAWNYYKLVSASEGDNSVGLGLKYVSIFGYGKPKFFGNCETHGPVWAIHHVPGYIFWPPIPKRVCNRPCLSKGERCRPACCETRCVYRFVWKCHGFFCFPLGWKRICYENQNACKCSCARRYPYCYL